MFDGDETKRKLLADLATVRKQLADSMEREKALRASESQARTLLNLSENNIAFLMDRNSMLIDVNECLANRLAKKREEMIGKFAYDFLPPELAMSRMEKNRELFRTGRPVRYEDERDGFCYDNAVYPIFGENGEITNIAVFAYDITDRKKTAEELNKYREHLEELVKERTTSFRESETKFKKLAEKSVVGIFLLQDGLLQYVNPMLAEIFGYSADEMTDAVRPVDLVVPDDWPTIEENIATMTSGKTESFHYELSIFKKSGESRNVEVYGSRIMHQGRPAIIGSLLDITERKKSKEELEIKSKILEEVNIALKVLLRQRDEDKKELEERLVSNVKELVLKYMEKLKRSPLNAEQRLYLRIIEENLNQILSPFLYTLKQFNLSPREAQIAFLIREGKTTKEMAQVIGVAASAVDTYRNKIRTKLNVKNKKVNLQLFLQSLK